MRIYSYRSTCERTMGKECYVHGYHIYMYMDIWEAAIGEELNYKWEPSNSVGQYTVAVVKGDTVISHLSKKLAHRIGELSVTWDDMHI